MKKILGIFCGFALLLGLAGSVFANASCEWIPEGNGYRYGICADSGGRFCIRCPVNSDACIMVKNPCYDKLPQKEAVSPPTPAAPAINTVIPGPSPHELLIQRQKEAHDLNEKAVQYYKNKQWKLATDTLKAAMEKNPDDPTIRSNYEKASAALAAETAQKKQESINTGSPNSAPMENPECTRWSRQFNGCDWRECPGYCEQCCGNNCSRVKCE